MKPAPPPVETFTAAVRAGFRRGAPTYDHHAALQRAVAWRLGRLCRDLPLPGGPRADLGAGSGLLGLALRHHCRALGGHPPLQVDLCPELLARNPLVAAGPATGPAGGLRWDLNRGLPDSLAGAALLASSFALQWLEDPPARLEEWCRQLAPGGWLALALPTAGSFPEWSRAARTAGVPFTALELPAAESLLAAVVRTGLEPVHHRRLRFRRPRQGGRATLRLLRGLGATAGRRPPLGVAELRRLLAHWPAETPLSWEVLVLVGRKG